MTLWTEHRDRVQAGGRTIRRLPYWAFKEITASFPAEDMAKIGRLNAKRESGAPLTAEEQEKLMELAGQWPVDALRGACFIPPVSGEEARAILAQMPRAESEELEKALDVFITPTTPTEADTQDPLAIILVATGGLGIDTADLTAGQGIAITLIAGGSK